MENKHAVWKSYSDKWKLQSQMSVKIKSNWWESNKHFSKMKSTMYFAKINTQKAEKYLSDRRKLGILAGLPARFLSTKKFSAWIDQSSHAIYLTRNRSFLPFREFSSVIPFMVRLEDSSQIKGRGYILMSSIIC